jgi:RimJ/RimL family protein N-acetyltransferase
MKRLVYGQNKRICEWVGPQIDIQQFDADAVAIGVEEDGVLIAGTVFNNYTGASIDMHVAAISGKRWATPTVLCCAFAYPFAQLKCNRVTGPVREDNLVSRRFVEHLGFKQEGLMRRGCEDGTNLILYGMLREECRWLGV